MLIGFTIDSMNEIELKDMRIGFLMYYNIIDVNDILDN